MYEFVCLPGCIGCRKAMTWLDSNGIEYKARSIKENTPTVEELSEWSRESGEPIDSFFSKSGALFKSMELKDKLPTMSDSAKLSLLTQEVKLIRRPILVGDGLVLVGFNEDEWSRALK